MKQTIYFLVLFFGFLMYTNAQKLTKTYDKTEFFSEKLYKVRLNNKYGFISQEDKHEIVPCKYDEVEGYFTENYDFPKSRVKIKGKYGLINDEAEEVVKCQYDEMIEFSEGLSKVKLDNRYGFIRENGHEIIPCQYEAANSFKEGLASVKLKGKWAVINREGESVTPFQYEDINTFQKGLASVKLKGKWGFINKEGKIIIPCQYDDVNNFNKSVASVKLKGKWGFVSSNGQEIIPCQYEAVNSFSEELARVKLRGKWGFISLNGQEIIRYQYEAANSFSEGLAAIKLQGKWGFIDTKGDEIISCRYDSVCSFEDGFAYAKLNGKWSAIDKNAKVISLFIYDNIEKVRNMRYLNEYFKYFRVSINNKWGIIDEKGMEIVSCKYEDVNVFKKGNYAYIKVKLNTYWGIVDTNGLEIIPCKYDEIDDRMSDERFLNVRFNNRWGVIDKKDEEVIHCEYDDDIEFEELCSELSISYVTSLYSKKGYKVAAYQYNEIWTFHGEFAILEVAEKWGIIDRNAKIITPFIYDSCSFNNAKNEFIFYLKDRIFSVKNSSNFIQDYEIQSKASTTLPKNKSIYYHPDNNKCLKNICETNSEIYPIKLIYNGKPLSSTELNVYVNGKIQAVGGGKAISKPINYGNDDTLSFNVKLELGLNKIQIEAMGEKTGELNVQYTSGKPTLYFCGIGISYKSNNKIDFLNYTEQDVQDIYTLFQDQKGENRLFEDVSPSIIKGVSATEGTILTQLGEYAAAFERGDIHPSDVLILYISGHGLLIDEKFHLACENYSPSSISHSTISDEEIFKELENVKCKKLVFIDACRENNGSSFGNRQIRPDLTSAMEKLMKPISGISLLTACKDGERSQENKEWQNGAFTEMLLAGFKGLADKDGNNLISIGEISNYVIQNVPKISPLQHPELRINELGSDLNIFVVK